MGLLVFFLVFLILVPCAVGALTFFGSSGIVRYACERVSRHDTSFCIRCPGCGDTTYRALPAALHLLSSIRVFLTPFALVAGVAVAVAYGSNWLEAFPLGLVSLLALALGLPHLLCLLWRRRERARASCDCRPWSRAY